MHLRPGCHAGRARQDVTSASAHLLRVPGLRRYRFVRARAAVGPFRSQARLDRCSQHRRTVRPPCHRPLVAPDGRAMTRSPWRPWAMPPCRFAWETVDRHRRLGTVAAIGLFLGAALAVFGLPPVDLHGPQHYVGIMAPTCGGTRAVREVLLGHLGLSWRYNPLGPLVVLGGVAVLAREALGRVCGRWVNVTTVHRPTVAVFLSLASGALEANQQAHAALVGPRDGASAPGSPILYGLAVFLVVGGACGLWLHRSRAASGSARQPNAAASRTAQPRTEARLNRGADHEATAVPRTPPCDTP
ncbi:DUF2752 domain-containing protein [Kitasatospora humi]|uniref:DUF2752 domain-containing protein n=1 Tax=Kitasatospora humi TaxID=2893891 RepID=UPI003556A8C0